MGHLLESWEAMRGATAALAFVALMIVGIVELFQKLYKRLRSRPPVD